VSRHHRQHDRHHQSGIMGYVALTTVPVIVCEMDKNISRDRKTLEATNWTNIGAFKWWFVTLVFNVMFIIMHAVSRRRRRNHREEIVP
jgi:hypothetical protein